MKLNDMPNGPILNTILTAAQAVLAESADMAHMLQKANQLLTHDFPIEVTQSIGKRGQEALAKGNGFSVMDVFVNPNGAITSMRVNHNYPPKYEVNPVQLASIEETMLAEIYASIEDKNFKKREMISWFHEYSPDSLK